MHEIAIDAENVFFWERGADEPTPSDDRLRYAQVSLEALIWWSGTHHRSDDADRVEGIRGYGKLDPAGRTYVGAVRRGGGAVRLDRVADFPRGRAAEGEHALILDLDFADGIAATYTLVGPEKDAGESVMLDAVRALVDTPGPHRVVLCSDDRRVRSFFAAGKPDDVSYLLAYATAKHPEHQGDARVAALSHLVTLHLHRERFDDLAPGEEVSLRLLDRLNVLVEPAPPRRRTRNPRRRPLVPPGPVASPADTLRRIDWAALVANPPDSPRWMEAWGDAEFQRLASTVITRDLRALAAVNGELGACIAGLLTHDEEAAHRAYRAIALLAVHYRQPPDRRDSLGAMLERDPELADLREPYLLVQPFLPPLPVATADLVGVPV